MSRAAEPCDDHRSGTDAAPAQSKDPIVPELLTGLTDYRLILYGSLLLVSIYGLPSGVVGALSGARAPARARAGPERSSSEDPAASRAAGVLAQAPCSASRG